MKRKIITGLAALSLIFVVSGIFIIVSIEKTTKDLDRLVMLHQVEILRENLLIQIKRVQSDLQVRNTRYSKGIDKVVKDVGDMERVAGSCFDCHHSETVLTRLNGLAAAIDGYKHSLSRVFTIRANAARLKKEENRAFRMGEDLIDEVNKMITFTSARLETRTHATLRKIGNIKIVLYSVIGFVLLSALFLGPLFVRGISRPIGVLLDATKKLKDGDLEYRIPGLQDEYGEVADSFNLMAGAIREQLSHIQQNEEKYRAVIDQSADCIFLVDAETKRVLETNRALKQLLDYSTEEATKLTLYDFVAHDQDDIDKKAHGIMAEGHHFFGERRYRRKDGTLIDVEVSANMIMYGGRDVLCVVARDISERKRVEEALRESETRYRTIFEKAGDAIFIISARGEGAGRIVSANNSAAVMHGYRVDELLTMNIRDLDTPEEADRVPQRIKRILYGEWIHEEITHRKKDGTVFPVEISAGLLEVGSQQFILAFDRDISERKRAEEDLKRAEHLKVVGELAAGLVHEIKNPLTGIKVSMEVFSQELDLLDEDKAIMLKVIAEIKRIELLMKSLLNYARPPRPHFMTTDLNYILDKTLTISLEYPSFKFDESKGITIVKEFDENLPSAVVDPMQMQQVFLNLFLNAADSMPDGGVLKVVTYFDNYANMVNIEISDTGIGIGEDLLKKVFDPFFTTKSKGSGLGLAITKQLIEQHGGSIDVSSSLNSGTVFKITFPSYRAREGATI